MNVNERSYEVSEEVQEFNEVPDDGWIFNTTFIRSEQYVIPSKSTWFVNMLESGVGRRVCRPCERSSTRTGNGTTLFGLPLVQAMAEVYKKVSIRSIIQK